jgi:hypothetical protein
LPLIRPVIQMTIPYNARRINVNKVHAMQKIVAHVQHLFHVRITSIVDHEVWDFTTHAFWQTINAHVRVGNNMATKVVIRLTTNT